MQLLIEIQILQQMLTLRALEWDRLLGHLYYVKMELLTKHANNNIIQIM